VPTFGRHGVQLLVVIGSLILLFSYYFSGGVKPIREGEFTVWQLVAGLSLSLVWLIAEAGFVEEFFFRAILQSRLSVLLRSSTAGIVVSALIFGLCHAPGLYLRGAESEGVGEQLPFLFWSAYTIVYMSVAGIFLAVVWKRTRNLWLVMVLHAFIDLLPNTPGFIRTWLP
jgi:membrane protease YdiL (CAAX protease family)